MEVEGRGKEARVASDEMDGNSLKSNGEEELNEDDDDDSRQPGAQRYNSDGRTNNEKKKTKKKKKNKDRRKVSGKKPTVADFRKRGVCYLSRIPRHMDHVTLRHILSQSGEVERIYLAPENPSTHINRKRAGGFRGIEFSEGWVEFADKSVAKRVARFLNGEQMGGKKRSTFYYDIWNIKYLHKFQWDDLTEEIAYKLAIKEQKMALEMSAAKRERDFYLSKVDQACALNSMEERAKKKPKTESTEKVNIDDDGKKIKTKVIRQFPQNRPVNEAPGHKRKPGLSKDILAGVFGGSTA